MRNPKIILSLWLLMFAAVSCGPYAPSPSIAPPTEGGKPPQYNLEDALTLAIQSLEAGTRNAAASYTSTGTATFTATPVTPGTPFTVLGEHHVALGETISCVGRAYGVSPQAIADANGFDLTSELHAGQVLLIPAVQWINISEGPVCAPQFALATATVGSLAQASPTRQPKANTNPTEPPKAEATQPPPPVAPTEPPPPVPPTKPPPVITIQPPPTRILPTRIRFATNTPPPSTAQPPNP